MLLPLLSYANNDTQKYGLDMPYNLEWVHLIIFEIYYFFTNSGTSSLRSLAGLVKPLLFFAYE